MSDLRNTGRTSAFTSRLMGGASMAALVALAATAAQAQAPAAPAATDTVEAVVVTGTSIRGVAPVGSSLVSVGQDAIQKTAAVTVQQILQNVPAIVGQGTAGQGNFGSADGAGVDAPTIHGLGASASNSTLILIDGHRIPLAGLNHALVDPNVIPPLALQRIEVLSDGASSVYGSDAVAGVVNFITRRNYNGFEANAQVGFGDKYRTYTAGFVGGKRWDTGSAMLAYSYSDRSALKAGDRNFTHANHISQGGSNLASFACGPATVGIGSLIYQSPFTTGVTNAAANAPCDYTGLADLLPRERRNNVMGKVTQEFGDRLTVNADMVYSNLSDYQRNTRGSVTSTIFGPGAANASQINPYFVTPPGVAATSETVRFDGNGLFGPGAYTRSGLETFYVSSNAEYKLDSNWRFTLGGVAGVDTSRQSIVGALNSSAVNLALNGATNGGGSLTAPSVPGASVVVLNTPLTTANALNPFLLAGNQTPASVLSKLTDSTQTRESRHSIQDLTGKIDGSLFKLPAGDVKVAVGGEYIRYTLHQDITQPLGIGAASTGSSTLNLNYKRTVKSAYAEMLAPIIGPDSNTPAIRRLDLSLSGRYDDYSDFGHTSNPKFGLNWEVVTGFKLRANYARSFVAPALTSIGNNGITGESGFGTYGNGAFNAPLAAYPALAGVPGCTAGAATCQLGTTVAGVIITGGNKNLKPQTGTSWSLGADFNPTFIDGLRLSGTFWHDKIRGGITAPSAAFAVGAPGLNSLLTVFPNGATPAQIAAVTGGLAQTSALPPTTYFIYSFQQRNALNLEVEGFDFDINYTLRTGMGRFDFQAGGSIKTKFNQQVGVGSAVFSVLNTTGFNTTFPSVKLETRSGLSWSSEATGFSANLFWNHTGSYYNWSGTTVTPITRDASGSPVGGGDKVRAQDTFDGHVAYDFKAPKGLARGVQIYVDALNIFNRAPPFYNVTAGYDIFTANPIGRVISIGARKRW
jgi:iron complex outermembrane receptor protein